MYITCTCTHVYVSQYSTNEYYFCYSDLFRRSYNKINFPPFLSFPFSFLPCLSFLFFLLLVIWQSVISEPQDARLKLDLPFIPFSSDRVYYYQLGSHMILCCSCCWSNSLNRRNAQNTISSSNKVSSSKQ